MIKLEDMEQLLKTFKELTPEQQEDILKYEMGSVLNPRKRSDKLESGLDLTKTYTCQCLVCRFLL